MQNQSCFLSSNKTRRKHENGGYEKRARLLSQDYNTGLATKLCENPVENEKEASPTTIQVKQSMQPKSVLS